MTRDRYSPGADPEPDGSPDSSEGRRSGLWASLKRAFGSPDPYETIPYLADDTGPVEPVRTPQPPAVPARAIPPPVLPEARLEDPLPAAVPPSSPAAAPVEAPTPARPVAAEAEMGPADGIPAAEESADLSKPTRLARGLASFSRSNSEREKKFAHILRDKSSSPSSKEKPQSRRRG